MHVGKGNKITILSNRSSHINQKETKIRCNKKTNEINEEF